MRGNENLGLIIGFIIIVVILIIAVIILNTTDDSATSTLQQQDFFYYCLFWSQYDYRGTDSWVGGECVNMEPYCAKALGVLCDINDDSYICGTTTGCLSEGQIESCRDMCRLKQNEG